MEFTDNRKIIRSYEDKTALFNYAHTISPPGTSPRRETDHAHRLYELMLILSGEQVFVVEGTEYRLSAGALIVLNDREHHHCHLNTRIEYERVFFHFDRNYFAAFGTDDQNLFAPFEGRLPGENNAIILNSNELDQVLSHIREVDRLLGTEDRDVSARVKIQFLSLLLLVESFYRRRGFSEKKPVPGDNRMTEIMSYISANYDKPLSPDILENNFNLSGSYISRLFRNHTGLTIKEYIRRKRIGRARELLLEGERAQEAGFSVGYNDYAHFYRDFRKETTLTPKEFISRFRKDFFRE